MNPCRKARSSSIFPVHRSAIRRRQFGEASNKAIAPDSSLFLNVEAYRFTVSFDEHLYPNDLVGGYFMASDSTV